MDTEIIMHLEGLEDDIDPLDGIDRSLLAGENEIFGLVRLDLAIAITNMSLKLIIDFNLSVLASLLLLQNEFFLLKNIDPFKSE
jgi:hypothetical protein